MCLGYELTYLCLVKDMRLTYSYISVLSSLSEGINGFIHFILRTLSF